MLVHIFKIIWNRKRSNTLIMAEVAIAFMIVFAIASVTIRNYKLYVEPLGFEYHNMWNITFGEMNGSWQQQRDQTQLKQLINLLEQQPQIKTVQLMKNPAFRQWRGSSSYEISGKKIHFFRNTMDDGAPETFGMNLIKGRWFGQQDKGQSYDPVIVNRHFVESFYPDKNPIGQNIAPNEKAEDSGLRERRIVGVFEDFRQLGELNELTPYVIYRYDRDYGYGNERGGEIHSMELKMTPGITVAYEEKLMQLLSGVAPNWDFTISSWEKSRENALQETFLPLLLAAIIGGFLIFMVAMGLFGVLWQNVTSRTQEIGLRRALGATAKGIHLQVISELLIVTLLGIVIALIFLIQLPILGVSQELTWSLFWTSQAAAILFMLLLSVSCAYYPGRLATEFSPAEALHYE